MTSRRTESDGGLGRVLGSSHSTPPSSGARFQEPGLGLASPAVWRRRRSQKTTLAAQAVFSSISYLRQLRRPRAPPPCSQAHPLTLWQALFPASAQRKIGCEIQVSSGRHRTFQTNLNCKGLNSLRQSETGPSVLSAVFLHGLRLRNPRVQDNQRTFQGLHSDWGS